MQFHIQYFALLRDQRGLDSESIDSDAPTAAALYQQLADTHQFSLPATSLKVAIDDEFAPWDTPLHDNASIVFIPPVAGG